ncbi:hypothetical protein ACHAXA_008011 [Cyclostephanos tholiformis]|uniref:Thioredoxin-like fold domain-containing protein n=1 Tax=Cyclostephanos tholiformis TaxID=382380 RepID=A0ABD3R929_9STRA
MNSPTCRRCVFVVSLLLLTSFVRCSSGQETATIVDEAAAADVNAAGGLSDAISNDGATESVIDLDAGTTPAMDETACGMVDDVDVDDKSTDGEAATTTPVDGDETTPEFAAADDQSSAEGVMPSESSNESESTQDSQVNDALVVQSGPFVDLLGDLLLSLEMIDETKAQFTPDLVNFYNKMNSRMGKKDEFEIVWISRCRTIDAFGQYFTQMNWLALPPNEAMGDRGKYLGEKFNVKSIPTLVLLDEIGNVITTDARNKIPLDKAGIGFPWRSPVSVLISTLVPRTFRLMVKGRLNSVMGMIKRVLLGKGTKITDALVRVIKR